MVEKIEESGDGLTTFTQGYKYFGVNVQPDNSVVCREWAPGAKQLFLTGEFSKSNLQKKKTCDADIKFILIS